MHLSRPKEQTRPKRLILTNIHHQCSGEFQMGSIITHEDSDMDMVPKSITPQSDEHLSFSS